MHGHIYLPLFMLCYAFGLIDSSALGFVPVEEEAMP